ncbi:MAG TPA: hypothetical protein VM260_27465, partial [Pirellula sp.]|nr:hypothetical protein [Pirellula sp.]
MAAALSESQWIESIEKHYLEDFIPRGGSAVKFAACFPPVEPVELGWKLRDLAHGKGLLVSEVDASTCRVHMVNQFLGRIADQIPWTQVSERILASYARKNHWAVPDNFTSEGLAEQIAQTNQRSVQAISNVLEGEIDQGTLPDRQMAKDFRTAMFHLLRARLFSGPASEMKQRHISDWLGGRTLAMSELRTLQIFSKVNRTNARHLLGSLIYWIRKAEFNGIAVVVNGSRLVASSRFTEGVNYTKASRVEAYQVFREF